MKGMALLWLLSSLLSCFATPLAVPLRIDEASDHEAWFTHDGTVDLTNNGRQVMTRLSRIKIALFREASSPTLRPLVVFDYQSRVKRPFHHNMRNDVDLILKLYSKNGRGEEQVLEQRIWGITRECHFEPPGKVFTFVPPFQLKSPFGELPLTQLVRAELQVDHQIRNMKECAFNPGWASPARE